MFSFLKWVINIAVESDIEVKLLSAAVYKVNYKVDKPDLVSLVLSFHKQLRSCNVNKEKFEEDMEYPCCEEYLRWILENDVYTLFEKDVNLYKGLLNQAIDIVCCHGYTKEDFLDYLEEDERDKKLINCLN